MTSLSNARAAFRKCRVAASRSSFRDGSPISFESSTEIASSLIMQMKVQYPARHKQLLWGSRSGRRGICRDVPVNCADEGSLPSSSRAGRSRDSDHV